jgi:predicted hydrocarbon binding protein
MPFRPERFVQNLRAQVDDATSERVIAGLPPYEAARSPARKAAWIAELMVRLEQAVGPEAAGTVMEACGRQCIGKSTLARARQVAAGAQDVDDLLARLNEAHLGGGHLRREGGVIRAAYDRCYCGSVSKAREPLSATYCRCSCGWYGELFEAALGQPVEVKLLGSIASGDEQCRFLIRP